QNCSEYGISEMLRPELPGPGDRIVDFPEGKLGVYTSASKDGMAASGTYSVEAVRVLDTHHTPIQKQPKALLCLVGISRRYYLGDDVYPTFHYDDDREMDLFSLIRAPNPTKAEASGQETAAPEVPLPEEVPVTTVPGGDQAAPVVVEPPPVQESQKRGREGIDANAPPKSMRRDHADLQPSGSSRGGKSLAAMQLCLASNIFVYEGVPADVSDPDPLAFADAPSPPPVDVIRSSQGVATAEDPGSENVSPLM
nr:hypothetical protein [Tanacetum cinerariifolium]